MNYRLIKNRRRRVHRALEGKSKSSSTLDFLCIDIETYRKKIEFLMTPHMNWSKIEIDHVKPICMFGVSDDEVLKLAFNWKDTETFCKVIHSQKCGNFNLLDQQLQLNKGYQFLKVNEKVRLNQDFFK